MKYAIKCFTAKDSFISLRSDDFDLLTYRVELFYRDKPRASIKPKIIDYQTGRIVYD